MFGKDEEGMEMRAAESWTETEAEGESLGLRALLSALGHVGEGETWYVSMKQLHLVSLDVCRACRKCSTMHVFVNKTTPRHLWLRRERERFARRNAISRTPPWTVRAITWETSSALISEGSKAFRADCRQRWCRGCLGGELDSVWWPVSLRELTFGRWFNEEVDAIVWPDSLQRLDFGQNFNQPIHRTAWPLSLEEVTFSGYFNQPIDKVYWPPSIKRLTFSRNFNRPIEFVTWPGSLRELNFGEYFNQPIEKSRFRAPLKEITFGRAFNQDVESVHWPHTMDRLTVGKLFQQDVDKVKRRGIHVYRLVRGWHDEEYKAL